MSRDGVFTSRRRTGEGLAHISHHGSGRAGLQPRRYKAFLIIPLPRAPRSPSADGLRGHGPKEGGDREFGGLKPRPSGGPLRASKRGEKCGLVGERRLHAARSSVGWRRAKLCARQISNAWSQSFALRQPGQLTARTP